LEKLQFLSEKSGLTAKKILSDLINSVFDIAVTYSSINFSFESSVLASTVTIQISGRNNLRCGNTQESFEEEKKRVEKVKKNMNWQIEVEESAKLLDKNVLVLINGLGQKLYMKPKRIDGMNFIELEPLTKEEMLSLGIEVQESYNQNYFDVSVEETESEPKKTKIFNANDPSDMAEAERIAQEQLRRLKEKDPEKWDLEHKEAEKDPDSEIERLKTELDDRNAKLEILAEKEYQRIKKENPEIKNLDDYRAWKEKSSTKEYIGAPLNAAQYGQSSQVGFESYEAMIDDLRSKAKEGDRNSELILKKLLQKSLKGIKSGKLQIEYPQTAEPQEDNSVVKEVIIGQGMGKDQPSELEKWTRPKRRRKVE
jgi:hypothetical protein